MGDFRPGCNWRKGDRRAKGTFMNDLVIEDGSVCVYVVLDVGQAIDLASAKNTLAPYAKKDGL